MPRLSQIGAACLKAFGFSSGNAAVTASYLVVAGGGGGGTQNAGGGGAGGLQTGTTSLDLATSYTVIVGAGGAGSISASSGAGAVGSSGSNSSFGTLTASVGGGGGSSYRGSSSQTAGNGGSGGGGGSTTSGSLPNYGTGTSLQGNNGGNARVGDNPNLGGGGGGSSAAGGSATGSNAGNGGAGTASSISGTSVTYAGGGGGASGTGYSSAYGTGGAGGGGNGSGGASAGSNGTVNLGGGGGGGGDSGYNGGSGGSGVVIISYAGAQQFGGGVVTTDGTNTIHTFTTSGTLSPLNSLTASYLIVAGGGGGSANASGGGAGGLLSGSGITIDTNSTYLVTVGAGGVAPTGSNPPSNGSNSTFSMVSTIAYGGGGGNTNTGTGNGGSGGGGIDNISYVTGGTGVAGQGYAGGNSNYPSSSSNGGGGGAGAAGANGTGTNIGGVGGVGVASSISGTSTYYAGGGGGAGPSGGSAGGLGGGGAGATSTTASSATANTGGGGGGGFAAAGGNGGSGIVIISYAGSTQQMAGGTVTIVGGNVIHTFTSSGYLTPLTYVGNSLRFRNSASAYLSRTPTVAGNRQIFTWSAWVKRGNLPASTAYVLLNSGNGNTYGVLNSSMYFYNDQLGMGAGIYGISTDALFTCTPVFRDPAAWYHIVWAVDTTQSADYNRMKVYVNGVQQTFSSATYPPQNYSFSYNNNVNQKLCGSPSGEYFDGYLAEVRMIDGQQLAPTAFGTFNSYGVWQPVNYGGSYGTNGYYLPFTATPTYTGLFNGSSYWASVPDNAAFTLGTNDFTVEAWINSSTYGGDTQFIIDQWNSASYGWAFSVNSATNIRFEYFTGGSYVNRNYTCPTLQANVWYHIAWVRKSGTTTVYLNGTAIGTSSDNVSIDNSTYQVAIGRNNDGGGSYVKNYLSNLRFVNGSAVYSSNFNPPTSPLTAVTNTQLLTLQSSTLVDNSPNAFTITNNGILMAQAMPFIQQVATDYSPQGNNWTPNNFGAQQTYNIDSMTDVPTLTSATAANYCVLNPLSINGFTLSAANMQAYTTASSDTYQTRGTFAVSSGKWYWESTVISSSGAGGAMVAVVDPTLPITTQNYTNSSAWSYYGYNGSKYNGSGTGYGASFGVNDVIGVALDMDNGTLTFYKNGTSQGTAFTNLTGKTVMPCLYTDGSYSYTAAINFGQQPFVYTPPAGYVGLNTYNM